MHTRNEIHVLLLCGIPAAGKSTFGKALAAYWKEQLDNNKRVYSEVIFISFDEHLTDWDNPNKKDALLKIGEAEEEEAEANIASIKRQRTVFLNEVWNFLDAEEQPAENRYLSEQWRSQYSLHSQQQQQKEDEDSSKLILLILDDNMYYSSMRQEVYQQAKKRNAGFFIVMLYCSKEKALERNSKREYPLPEEVILRMYDRMEVPLYITEEAPFSIGLSLPTLSIANLDTLANMLAQKLKQAASFIKEKNQQEWIQAQQREKSRISNQLSTAHQIDLQLRKIIHEVFETKITDKEARGKMSKPFQQLRQKALEDFKKNPANGAVILHRFRSQLDIMLKAV